MAGFLMRDVMQEIKPIIIQPCSRVLKVYYAIALFIISLFFTGAIFSLISPLVLLDLHIGVYILGIVSGIGILAIVVWIHLEMKTATYTITEKNAQSRWGLLIKRSDLIQLGAVRSVKVRQGPLQHAFNLGDVILYTTSHSPLVLWDIDQPETKRKEIWELVMKASPRGRFR
jgi:membrane protein YdbS with pleckstrin-like domain